MRRPVVVALVSSALAGCGASDRASPFGDDAGAADSALDAIDGAVDSTGGFDAGAIDVGVDADETLGGPCLDDGVCDDGVDCTRDGCDVALGRCRHVPEAAGCDDGAHCNGVEVCDRLLGCRPGAPVTCSDDDTCTIDRCVEATKSCVHEPRDVDGDGDPDGHCPGGHDCDDQNALVSSLAGEVCSNSIDDDCDGETDEPACSRSSNDDCAGALSIASSGTYVLDAAGAKLDYGSSCGTTGTAAARDVVATIVVPAGGPADVDVVGEVANGALVLALASVCGDPSSEIACAPEVFGEGGRRLARVRGRALAPGTYALYAFTDGPATTTLRVSIGAPTAAPSNETCGLAAPVVVDVTTVADLTGTARDVASACGGGPGDLVYAFTLAAAADVRVEAASVEGFGRPIVSLRSSACSLASDEIACATDASAVDVFARALAAGTYTLAVSSTAPDEVAFTVRIAPPTAAPPDDVCATALPLAPATSIDVDLAGHADDVRSTCLPGAVDAAYDVVLARASDVLLVESLSSGDVGAVSLEAPACATASDALACRAAGSSPVRAALRGAPAGEYRAVVESRGAKPVRLTAFVRDAVADVLVPFADACADALEIAPEGGAYAGNTANAVADFSAACDTTTPLAGGAGDQLLKLTLAATKRVVLDMAGSSYTTILELRSGPTCPGAPVASSCDVGFDQDRSFLDRTLPAGTYWLQVDGYGGETGAWRLDVRVVDP